MARAGLTTGRIVDAAAEMIDREGGADLSLARLADHFGVKTPSLYNHVAGFDDLLRRVGLATLEELAEVCRSAAMGRSGPEALRAIASAYREAARQRPGSYQLIQAAYPEDEEWQEATRRVLEPFLVSLAGMGLEGDAAIHAIRIFRSALHGFVSLENGGGFGIDLSVDETYDRLVEAVIDGLAGSVRLSR